MNRPAALVAIIFLSTPAGANPVRMTQDVPPLTQMAVVAPPDPAVAPVLPAARTVGWGSGERLTYNVRIAGIHGGRMAMAVGGAARRDGRTILRIRARGETVPFISAFKKMSEEITTLVDLLGAGGLRPVSSAAQRKVTDKDRLLKTEFGDEVTQTIHQRGEVRRHVRRITGSALDPLTALFALRSRVVRPGETFGMLLLSGTSLYRANIRVTGPERVLVKGKMVDALRLDGTARRILDDGRKVPGQSERGFSFWFSADRRRIPLRAVGDTTLGTVEASLSSYQPARRGLRVRPAQLPSREKLPAGGAAIDGQGD